MWKIVTVLVVTVLTVFAARLADDAPCTGAHLSVLSLETSVLAATPTPSLMYAGIRG